MLCIREKEKTGIEEVDTFLFEVLSLQKGKTRDNYLHNLTI